MKPFLQRYAVALAVVGAALVYLIGTMMPPAVSADRTNVPAFGQITVLEHGRYKPLDTFARTTLKVLSNREDVTIDKEILTGSPDDAGTDRQTLSATGWLLDLLATSLAKHYALSVLIYDPDVAAFLKADPAKGPRYSPDDLDSKRLDEFLKEVQAIAEKDKAQRTPAEERRLAQAELIRKQMVAGYQMERGLQRQKINPFQVRVFRIENDQLLALLDLKQRFGLRYSYAEIIDKVKANEFRKVIEQARAHEEKQRDLVETKALELYKHVETYSILMNLEGLEIVPPTEAKGQWLSLGQALDDQELRGANNPNLQALTHILLDYATGNAKEFDKRLDKYLQVSGQMMPRETSTSGTEVFLNQFSPFYQCLILYVGVFLLAVLAWLRWAGPLNRAAFWLMVLALLVHTIALIMRMAIMGRPPVTNLYSSAVFIGWAAVVLCVILEAIFRNGFGSVVAAMLGVVTMLIAMHLGSGNDTMDVLVAVLDTNFWLATHVVCITLGYVGSYVAGFLGMVYIFRGLLTPSLDRNLARDLYYATYGIVCFAMVLSFIGTVLGGIWADQSWGRFWGWDPKENGALLIVIWNAVILHARWGGLIKERGLALLCVAGNMITTWSWFGTNQLSVGLHNYGFNSTLARAVVASWAVFSLFLVAGSLPLKYWRSFRVQVNPVLPAIEPPVPQPRKGQPSTRLRPA
jgi:ABC-type transport system involved in cytochrome c biogenesis permease subunit